MHLTPFGWVLVVLFGMPIAAGVLWLAFLPFAYAVAFWKTRDVTKR